MPHQFAHIAAFYWYRYVMLTGGAWSGKRAIKNWLMAYLEMIG
jgi:hypothetical protein